jgi:hypothetical protein
MTSINMIFFMGGPQLGEVEAGLVAAWFGAPASVILGGVACLAATSWIAIRAQSLRAYRVGAGVPESDVNLETATAANEEPPPSITNS